MPELAEVTTASLSVTKTADRLGLSRWSVYQIIAAGKLPVHRTGPRGRTLRIAEADLIDYLRRIRSPAKQ